MQGETHDQHDVRPWMSIGRLGFALMLTLGLGLMLGACGGKGDHDSPDSPGESVGGAAEGDEAMGAGAATDDDAGDADADADADAEDSAAEEDAAVAPTEEPTEPPTATDVPTVAPTEAPTDPPAAVPATAAPTTVPAPTAAPAQEWFVEFYPDNWTYQIPKDQLCAGINWRSSGVTDLIVGRVGTAGESVEAEGQKGDNCFSEQEAEFFLEYKRPDGQVERKQFKVERTKNKSD